MSMADPNIRAPGLQSEFQVIETCDREAEVAISYLRRRFDAGTSRTPKLLERTKTRRRATSLLMLSDCVWTGNPTWAHDYDAWITK